jgi:hypothetical protein
MDCLKRHTHHVWLKWQKYFRGGRFYLHFTLKITLIPTCNTGMVDKNVSWGSPGIKVTYLHQVFSSGGDKVNNSGIALYLWHGELYCSAKKDKAIWTAKQKLGVKPGEWHSFQVSWNKQNGFIVYLDGHFFIFTFHSKNNTDTYL